MSCVVWRGVAWRGVAWRGVAWRGVRARARGGRWEKWERKVTVISNDQKRPGSRRSIKYAWLAFCSRPSAKVTVIAFAGQPESEKKHFQYLQYRTQSNKRKR